MALEDIFRALEDQAQLECDQILESARDQAEAIVQEATEEAESIRSSRIEESERLVMSRAARTLNTARMDGKKRVSAVKEQAVSATFDKALNALSSIRGTAEYPTIFSALVDETVAGLDGEIEVLVDPADAEMAAKAIAQTGLTASIRPDAKSAGGLTVSTNGGRIMRRNTLESRLEKVGLIAQAEVAEILFP
ncbi:MAG: V-type ATP synthase subunit E [Coriobacteriia bacterium]